MVGSLVVVVDSLVVVVDSLVVVVGTLVVVVGSLVVVVGSLVVVVGSLVVVVGSLVVVVGSLVVPKPNTKWLTLPAPPMVKYQVSPSRVIPYRPKLLPLFQKDGFSNTPVP